MSRDQFAPSSWSIDELAVLVGLPTRTLREYRTMSLIDPPRMQGRVGRYDGSHRDRLELIARLQARGYSLAAIRDLCTASATGQSLEEVLGGQTSAAIDDAPVALTTDELVRAVKALADEQLRSKAIEAGLIHIGDADNVWLVRTPALLSLVADAIDAGATPTAALRLIAGLVEGARLQATALADLVVDELWDERDPVASELVSMGRRTRLLLCQAAAALVVDAVGTELLRRATMPGRGGLDKLVEGLRVGAVRNSHGAP